MRMPVERGGCRVSCKDGGVGGRCVGGEGEQRLLFKSLNGMRRQIIPAGDIGSSLGSLRWERVLVCLQAEGKNHCERER